MRELFYSKKGKIWILLLIGVLLGGVFSAVYLRQPPFVASLNHRTTDAVMRQAPLRPASGSVIIVDIDDKSLARYGQWPWPRSLLAQLLKPIAKSGAAAIALDLILSEPDRASLDHSRDPDRELSATLAKGPYVLGYAFLFGHSPNPQQKSTLHPPRIVLVNLPDAAVKDVPLFTAHSVICDLPSFSNAVRRSGFINATPDGDGVLRRVPTLIRFEDSLYPSFALATLMQYAGKDQLEIVWREASGRLDLLIGKMTIPVDRHGNLAVRFSGAIATPRVSASDVLEGKQALDRFSNKIVLVGSSAAGLQTTYMISAGTLHEPTQVHAQVLENLLTGQRVIRTGRFVLWEILIALAVAACTALAVATLGILPSAGVCVALMAGCWLGSGLAFRSTGYLFSPLLPTIVIVFNYAVLTIVETWRALAEKQLQLEKINIGLEERIAEAVADLRHKDQILIQQGRHAAMGEMISNIAHQWRQPLNLLGLIVQELRMMYGRPEFDKELLDASVAKAMQVIQHMSQTIEDFRTYFKPDKEKTRFRASEAVDRTLSLVGPSLAGMQIRVEVKEKHDSEIYGYPNEYSQVLLNILLNSRDAFESTVESRRAIIIEIDQEGDKSVVTITDNAGGVQEEVIEKIFDPYFTTKPTDKGTGIGLYMAKTIIEKNMGGKIAVRNTDDGAQFRIEV